MKNTKWSYLLLTLHFLCNILTCRSSQGFSHFLCNTPTCRLLQGFSHFLCNTPTCRLSQGFSHFLCNTPTCRSSQGFSHFLCNTPTCKSSQGFSHFLCNTPTCRSSQGFSHFLCNTPTCRLSQGFSHSLCNTPTCRLFQGFSHSLCNTPTCRLSQGFSHSLCNTPTCRFFQGFSHSLCNTPTCRFFQGFSHSLCSTATCRLSQGSRMPKYKGLSCIHLFVQMVHDSPMSCQMHQPGLHSCANKFLSRSCINKLHTFTANWGKLIIQITQRQHKIWFTWLASRFELVNSHPVREILLCMMWFAASTVHLLSISSIQAFCSHISVPVVCYDKASLAHISENWPFTSAVRSHLIPQGFKRKIKWHPPPPAPWPKTEGSLFLHFSSLLAKKSEIIHIQKVHLTKHKDLVVISVSLFLFPSLPLPPPPPPIPSLSLSLWRNHQISRDKLKKVKTYHLGQNPSCLCLSRDGYDLQTHFQPTHCLHVLIVLPCAGCALNQYNPTYFGRLQHNSATTLSFRYRHAVFFPLGKAIGKSWLP